MLIGLGRVVCLLYPAILLVFGLLLEFKMWSEEEVDNGRRLYNKKRVKKKLKDLDAALNYQHTAEDIANMLEKKRKAGVCTGPNPSHTNLVSCRCCRTLSTKARLTLFTRRDHIR